MKARNEINNANINKENKYKPVSNNDSDLIDFKKFLQIIKAKNIDGTCNNSLIIDFFREMVEGKISGRDIPVGLPFKLIISSARR